MKRRKDLIDCFISAVYWIIGVHLGLIVLAGVIVMVWEV